MKRYGIIIPIFFILTLTAAWTAGAVVIPIKGSKHDLSTLTGPGPYKSDTAGGTTEICVFCHTPHGGNTDAPLWNRTAALTSYTTYTSDVMAALGYPVEDPSSGVVHKQTRICLSCHDGTVAMGKLANLPYGLYDEIPIQNTSGGLMPETAAGYIGANLQDDHPVAVQHRLSGKDPELVSVSGSLTIKLYKESGSFAVKDNADGNYIECTSCHNPHDNQWGNFLVDSNQNSALCLQCHLKAGFSTSIHATDITTAYAPPTEAPPAGGNPANHGPMVGDVKCMNCHFPHKAAGSGTPPNLSPADFVTNPNAGYYLLSFPEEKSCFNTNGDRWNTLNSATKCHGTTGSGKDIKTLLDGTRSAKHPVTESGLEGRHKATEARQQISGGWAGTSVWHVECADCHNPHTAGNTSRSKGSHNVVSNSSIFGTSGVEVTSAPVWDPITSTGTYNVPPEIQGAGVTNNNGTTGAQYEYQICLKCHSDFAWGTTNPPNIIYNSGGLSQLTNQAREFGNAGGGSSHPVIYAASNDQGDYNLPWTSNTGQTMYCSDCHSSNVSGDAAGPHGSNGRAILAKTYNPATVGQDTANDLCYVCHNSNTYYSGVSSITGFYSAGPVNLHFKHMAPSASGGVPYLNNVQKACTNCHVNPPHGSKRVHLVSLSTGSSATPDPAPYGTYSYIKTFTDKTPGNYAASDCTAALCHAGSH